jgi:hypothetical protein
MVLRCYTFLIYLLHTVQTVRTFHIVCCHSRNHFISFRTFLSSRRKVFLFHLLNRHVCHFVKVGMTTHFYPQTGKWTWTTMGAVMQHFCTDCVYMYTECKKCIKYIHIPFHSSCIQKIFLTRWKWISPSPFPLSLHFRIISVVLCNIAPEQKLPNFKQFLIYLGFSQYDLKDLKLFWINKASRISKDIFRIVSHSEHVTRRNLYTNVKETE